MTLPPLEHRFAGDVAEAIEWLGGRTDAELLSGGQAQIPRLRRRRGSRPGLLVDISRIPALRHLGGTEEELIIGATVTLSELGAWPELIGQYPILVEAICGIADPQVRNLATVGGNLCQGATENDLPAPFAVLPARLYFQGRLGPRIVDARAFFPPDGLGSPRDPTEVLTEIRLDRARPGEGAAYEKAHTKVGDPPIAGVAAALARDGDGRLTRAAIAFTNVGGTARGAPRTEEFLRGARDGSDQLDVAAGIAAKECLPVADVRGPVPYKREVVRRLTEAALRRADARARGVPG